jgi:hypothetical protein
MGQKLFCTVVFLLSLCSSCNKRQSVEYNIEQNKKNESSKSVYLYIKNNTTKPIYIPVENSPDNIGIYNIWVKFKNGKTFCQSGYPASDTDIKNIVVIGQETIKVEIFLCAPYQINNYQDLYLELDVYTVEFGSKLGPYLNPKDSLNQQKLKYYLNAHD